MAARQQWEYPSTYFVEAVSLDAKRVVVIGSGIGGAGVASLLQARGCEVTLLERNPFPGGKCWGFEKDGYLVDSGVHMFSMGPLGPHGEIDRLVGGDLQWVKGDPGSTSVVRGKFGLLQYQSVRDPRTYLQFGKAAVREFLYKRPGAGDASARRKQKASNELHGAQQRGGVSEVIRTIVKLVRRNEVFISDLDEVTSFEFLSGFTDNELLHQIFAAASMILLVIPYTRSSAGELMYVVSNMYEKAYLSVPRGGSREIPGSWLRSFERNGGELVLGAEVEKITVDGGAATGVTTTDGREFTADAIISNAGIKKTIGMAGEESFPADYVASVGKLMESYSFITTKLGLTGTVVDAKTPNYCNVPNVDPVTMFDYVESGTVPEDPFLFVPFPTWWERRAAPLGRQLAIMGVPGPSRVDENSVRQCEAILDRGEQRLFEMFPAIEKNIEWKMRTHIRDTSLISGRPTGECIGLAQIVGQTGIHKPSVKTPLEGLYLVGCDAGARGTGTEQAAASALYVAGLLG